MVGPHGTPPPGAPDNGFTTGSPEDLRIYPHASGASHCASGWHVIFLTWWDDTQYHDTRNDLFAYLSSVDIQFAWDDVSLVEQRTAIKRWVNSGDPDFQDAFMFNAGTFMRPGTMTVGEHTLTTTIVDPLYGSCGTWSVDVTVLPC